MREKYVIRAGSQFGRLTVVEDSGKRKNDYIVWRCRCQCGNYIDVDKRALLRGTVTSCGCAARIRPDQLDITGERFGLLTAEYCTGKKASNGSYIWRLRCDCGNTIEENARELTFGYRRSCGCLQAKVQDEAQSDGSPSLEVQSGKARLNKNNTSGYTGVYLNRQADKWISQIMVGGKWYYLGSYEKKDDAIKARKRGEQMYDCFLDWYYAEHPQKESVEIAASGI